MTDQLTALRELVAKVEGPDHCDRDWFYSFGHTAPMLDSMHRAYNGSLDAAKALHEALLPGWTVSQIAQLRKRKDGQGPTGEWLVLLFHVADARYTHTEAKSDDPARAWLIAILKAKIAELEATQ